MTDLAIIGAGAIGSTVAKLAVRAGMSVVVTNSRGPASLVELIDTLGPSARAVDISQIPAGAPVVVIALPIHAYPELVALDLAETIVVDTGNYSPDRDGHVEPLDDGSLTTGQYLRQLVAPAHVVKAFNTIHYAHLLELARPVGAADRSTLPIAGDDGGAKSVVSALLDRCGYDSLDIGAAEHERWITPGQAAFGLPYVASGVEDLASAAAVPADRDTVLRAVGLPGRMS
ncbi:MAG: NAD(P)-binding domain-containing protein [Nakamurella sp.]